MFHPSKKINIIKSGVSNSVPATALKSLAKPYLNTPDPANHDRQANLITI